MPCIPGAVGLSEQISASQSLTSFFLLLVFWLFIPFCILFDLCRSSALHQRPPLQISLCLLKHLTENRALDCVILKGVALQAQGLGFIRALLQSSLGSQNPRQAFLRQGECLRH